MQSPRPPNNNNMLLIHKIGYHNQHLNPSTSIDYNWTHHYTPDKYP